MTGKAFSFRCVSLTVFVTTILSPFFIEEAFSQHQASSVYESERVEASIEAGLAYLHTVQKADGSYPEKYGNNGGISALAGMAFLAKGYTPDSQPYGENIVRSVKYILNIASDGGYFGTVNNDNGQMYVHSICTLFLSEVSGMVEPELQYRLDEVLPKANKILLDAQNIKKDQNHKGGWRYRPNSKDSDMSCSGWALMALRSCRLNGGLVPPDAIDRAVEYVKRHQNKEHGFFMYQVGNNSGQSTLSGAGILCLELCGQHNDPVSLRAAGYLLKNFRQLERASNKYYGLYYASQGLFQIGGEAWQSFSEWMYRVWIPKQKADGSWRGSANEDSGPYSTSLVVLAFTVPFRQLPIYQRDETVDEE